MTPPRWRLASLLALVAGARAAWPLWDPDLYWHLSYGRAILGSGSRTFPEPHAIADLGPAQVTAQEWLWDVGAYVVYAAVGPIGIQVGLVATSVLMAVATARFASRLIPRNTTAWFAISALVVDLVLHRMTARPESLSLALLPLVLTGILDAGRSGKGATIALTTSLFALSMQVHPLAVLALFAAPLLLPFAAWLDERRAPMLVLLSSLFLASFTGPLGFGWLANLLKHFGSDAAMHITDMRPLTWSDLDLVHFHAQPLFALWMALALTGMFVKNRPRSPSVLSPVLALAAVAVWLGARRGVSPAALLALPFFAAGLWPFAVRFPLLALGTALAAHVHGFKLDAAEFGEWGRFGWLPGQAPTAAATYLQTRPGNVLSDYAAGAPIGFLNAGQSRTWVDGRTPLVFDDAAFALSRDRQSNPDGVEAAGRALDAHFAVAAHGTPYCTVLEAAGWTPVLVEIGWTTFDRDAATGLATLHACDTDATPGLDCAGITDDYSTIRPMLDNASNQFLSALVADSCQRFDQIPSGPAPAPSLAATWASISADGARSHGHDDVALDLLAPWVERGDKPALLRALPLYDQPAWSESAVEHLAPLAARLDDALPADIRLVLAKAYAREGDLARARLHAERVARVHPDEAAALIAWLNQVDPE